MQNSLWMSCDKGAMQSNWVWSLSDPCWMALTQFQSTQKWFLRRSFFVCWTWFTPGNYRWANTTSVASLLLQTACRCLMSLWASRTSSPVWWTSSLQVKTSINTRRWQQTWLASKQEAWLLCVRHQPARSSCPQTAARVRRRWKRKIAVLTVKTRRSECVGQPVKTSQRAQVRVSFLAERLSQELHGCKWMHWCHHRQVIKWEYMLVSVVC